MSASLSDADGDRPGWATHRGQLSIEALLPAQRLAQTLTRQILYKQRG